jgi:uncharacterized protein
MTDPSTRVSRPTPSATSSALTNTLDLRALEVPSGGARTLDVRPQIEPLALGGQTYRCDPAAPQLRLDAVRPLSGWHLRLRGEVDLVGPCWRCLAEARIRVQVDGSEIDDPAAADPEMESEYVDRDQLELAVWARGAVAEALPGVIVCRDDCAGLCPSCGTDLNAETCDCTTDTSDPRWAGLADIAKRLHND